jgi:hypothetical protein
MLQMSNLNPKLELEFAEADEPQAHDSEDRSQDEIQRWRHESHNCEALTSCMLGISFDEEKIWQLHTRVNIL